MNINSRPVRLMLGLAAFGICIGFAGLGNGTPSDDAKKILDATGVSGGFVVHLGCGDGKLTAALRTNERYQVHGLARSDADVAAARRHIQGLGQYGHVAVDRLDGQRLPYVDNMANLIVAERMGDVRMSELDRVLAPNGVAYIKKGDSWNMITKPRPDNIDDWTHFMHDPSGNAVAHDDVVGPPRHLQWLGSPRWSRHHDRMASMSALVSSGGRIFYIMDEGSRISIQMPPRWTLVARDAFNGTVLWKQPINEWHNHLWPLKSGPTQLARRLVALGDKVYVTLGLRAPLTAIDAATGKILKTYDGTASTEEIIASEDQLLLVVNKGESELTDYAPKFNVGDQRRVREEYFWNEKPRLLMAVDADSGNVRWQFESRVAPLTLAANADRAFFHDGEKVVCIDRKNGEPAWSSQPAARRPNVTMNFGPKLVVYQNVLLFAGGDRSMRALDIETGKQLWTAPHAQSGYQSPEDLLVAGGLVWNAPTTRTNDTGVFIGRDPLTGDVKSEFAPNVETYWFHHRCYIAKATDKFLMPSRTGIEFVDHQKEDWDINHWVRGGCLYGVMPSNGLVYAPPHNCACYPEAKLYGMNALAPTSSTRRLPADVSEAGRLERGPAFDDELSDEVAAEDWPTYRYDAARSGSTKTDVSAKLDKSWRTDIGGKLSSVVVADGRLFVSQVDAHTIHALDASTGKKLWSYTTGGRVDSPPSIYRGRVLFGSTDGWVYSLRARDGALAWRFRAAPRDERLMAFEQLESVWPVHGTVLVENDVAYFVAGRSVFLDGGLRFFRLDAATGRKISENVLDERDPETGENLQSRIQVLNMPVGLPDILSSDGRYVYMRSQQFDFEGNRLELGPHSGNPAQQGGTQAGETRHLFAPMGFLDDTWFHRAYWVYGRSFAGGHSGYHQAGKYTSGGRLLVNDEENVYGFGRKPQYYKWTTTIEHQLFATGREAPKVATGRRGGASMVQFANKPSLNPTGKPIAVEAWVNTAAPNGVVLARGGPAQGFALILSSGRPEFLVRVDEKLSKVAAKRKVTGRWVHLVGQLTGDKELQLFVDGRIVAKAAAASLLTSDPKQAMEIGADNASAVGEYKAPNALMGAIDEVRVYYGTLTADDVRARASDPDAETSADRTLVLACSFNEGDAQDASGKGNHGERIGVQQLADAKFGRGLRFRGGSAGQQGSFVKHHWTVDIPLLAHAMVKADAKLFVAGPPDLIDEEKTFPRIMSRDPRIGAKLAEQDEALDGKQGGVLRVVSAKDGSTLAEYKLDSLPSWDGMAVARGSLFMSTADGGVVCYSAD